MEMLNFKGPLSDLIYILKKGGSIHIKKKNRGKFTESAKRAGMGVQEYARHILANKDKYSSTLVKRANFARNAKKFKHENGGIIKYQNPSDNLPPLIQRVNKSKANFVQRLLDPNRKHIQNWVNPLSISTHKLGWATEDTKQGAFVYPEVQEIDGELIDFTHPSHLKSEGMNSAIERRDTVRMTPEQAKWFTENYKQYYPGFQNGGNLYSPQPLSPLDIAMKQAKTMAKMREAQPQQPQQHLPPGVKEVVGPDGKKVAIRTEQPLVPLEQSVAEWLPGTGDVAEVGYIANDIKNGNLGSATLGAGLLLLPGNAGKMLRGKRIANKLNSFIKKTSPEKISRYNEVQFIDRMFTDPNRAVHVSPNSVYGATKTKKAAHSIGNKWIPGTADVSKVGEDNLVWLWKGSPYRHQWNDQTFISIPIQDDMIQTRQKGAIAVPEIDLTSNETVILTKNPIVGNFEKHIFIK